MVQDIRNKCYVYQMALNISYINNFSLSIYLQYWPRYRYSKFRFCLLRSAIIFSQGYGTRNDWRPGQKVRFDPVVAEIRHSEVGLLVPSAMNSMVCLHTERVCLRVFTRIEPTVKQSYCRTPRSFQNVLCTFRNLSNWFDSRKTLPFYALGK